MGVTINKPAAKGLIATQNLWLNKEKTEVLESEPDQGFVLAVEGAAINQEDIDLYDIDEKFYKEYDEEEAEKADVEAKSHQGAAGNKKEKDKKAANDKPAKADS